MYITHISINYLMITSNLASSNLYNLYLMFNSIGLYLYVMFDNTPLWFVMLDNCGLYSCAMFDSTGL